MEKLRELFAGYSDAPPLCFVLMGDFLSSAAAAQGTATPADELRRRFRALAELIREFPALVQHSKFVFVPGSFRFLSRFLGQIRLALDTSSIFEVFHSRVFVPEPGLFNLCRHHVLSLADGVSMLLMMLKMLLMLLLIHLALKTSSILEEFHGRVFVLEPGLFNLCRHHVLSLAVGVSMSLMM